MAAVAVLMSAHSHGGGGGDGGFPLSLQYGAPPETSTHSRWYTEMTESTPWQVLLLTVVVIDAALIGEGMFEFTEIVRAFRNLSLLCLVILATGVICGRERSEESAPTSFIVCITILLVSSTIFSMFFPDRALTCQLIAVSLAAPYIALCSKQAELMHIFISLSVVLPSILVSNITSDYIRVVLILPAVVFIAYKSTAIICSKIIPTKIVIKVLLFFSGATIIAGALFAAAEAAQNQSQSLCGLFLAACAAIAFNACLVAQRWENSDGDVIDQLQAFFGRSTMSLGRRTAALIATILLMLANLQLIYTCLSFSRVAVFLPIILLISLYFLFIHLEDPIRTYLHESKRKTILNSGYFLLILGSLCLALLSASYQSLDNQSKTNREISIDVIYLETDKKRLRDTASFATLQACLMFIYFMMTTLIKTDKQAKLAAEDAFVRVLSRAAITTTAPVQPAEQKTSDDDSDGSSESFDVAVVESPVIHATLNEPD